MAYVSAAGQRPEDALKQEENPAAESTGTPEADSNPTESSAPAPEATAPEQSQEEDEEDDEDEGSRKRFVKKYD